MYLLVFCCTFILRTLASVALYAGNTSAPLPTPLSKSLFFQTIRYSKRNIVGNRTSLKNSRLLGSSRQCSQGADTSCAENPLQIVPNFFLASSIPFMEKNRKIKKEYGTFFFSCNTCKCPEKIKKIA